jgi:hypothetical protein
MKRARALSLGVTGALLLLGLHGCLALVDFKETCLTDSDCASGLTCNSGQCTDSCNEYSNCGSGKYCDKNKCVAIPTCTSSNQAVCGKYACNTSAGTCYASCQGPNSQRDSSKCNSSTICTYDYTCLYGCSDTYDPICGAYVCDDIMGYCRDDCSDSADCASGYSCKNRVCTR